MTWTAKIMPDDQLDPASLVGGMLQVEQQGEITGDGSSADGRVRQPLWECMDRSRFIGSHSQRRATDRFLCAVEIMALRDWLFLQTCHTTYALEVRDLLTEQARIARAGHPTDETEGAS